MSHNQYIAELGPLLFGMGIRHVIICPGSRNAPLTQLFTSADFHCHSIVDERSAGYVALGMARQLQEPVVVLTTSGTAVLNLAPAVAEAYFQQIPLVVITADRPPDKIPQFNNQWLDQRAPFYAFSKGFYQSPQRMEHPDDLMQATERVARLAGSAVSLPAGPVHLNVTLEEPLYESLPAPVLAFEAREQVFEEKEKVPGLTPIGTDQKIMVLAGMASPDEEIRKQLTGLVRSGQVVVIAENISNLRDQDFIAYPELVLAATGEAERETLFPDVVITFGGQVVSKRLKLLLQGLSGLLHYEIGTGVAVSLEQLIPGRIDESGKDFKNQFLGAWKEREKIAFARVPEKLASLSFGNLHTIGRVLDAVPDGSVLHLGNSSAIRYSQVLPYREDLTYYSNRGTSGIDGCVSAAVGAAMVSGEMHVLLVGDLSFVYDSNAMWNKDFPANLKIVVLNDRGGGIFRLLNGPSQMDFFEEYSVTQHPVSPVMLAQSFGQTAKRAENRDELEEALPTLFNSENRLAVLEVDTSESENSRIFKEFLDYNL